MNIGEAVKIIERQAKWDGVGILELLVTVDKYGVDTYIDSAGLNHEFRQAYYTFMSAGRQMFAKA
ncbi:MAG: hypothetical protein EB127_12370 [Alphaproteobacteria bacterium]|nr:hypothetical protein [Alphaproteobacteria bacterium]